MAFCAHHQALASHAFTRRTVIHSAAELLGSKHKLVVLGVVRMFRAMVRSGPVFLPFLMKYNYLWRLAPLVQPTRPATGLADDLVSSAVLEFIAGLGELPSGGTVPYHLKDLVVHLCDERSNLEGKRHIAVVEKLFQTKEEMEKGERGDTSPRRRDKLREERLREEAWFDDDDDDDV